VLSERGRGIKKLFSKILLKLAEEALQRRGCI